MGRGALCFEAVDVGTIPFSGDCYRSCGGYATIQAVPQESGRKDKGKGRMGVVDYKRYYINDPEHCDVIVMLYRVQYGY